jgi:hypothetical protein
MWEQEPHSFSETRAETSLNVQGTENDDMP